MIVQLGLMKGDKEMLYHIIVKDLCVVFCFVSVLRFVRAALSYDLGGDSLLLKYISGVVSALLCTVAAGRTSGADPWFFHFIYFQEG